MSGFKRVRGGSLWIELFGIDPRSLALFRVALGSLLLYDVLDRSRDLVAHYTELGMVPVAMLPALRVGSWATLSLHAHASGSVLLEGALFALAAVLAVALILGFHTRLVTWLCWYLLVSVHARNPWISGMGGDFLLRLFLFWGGLLPLGLRFSLDAVRRPDPAAGQPVLSIASAALLLQLGLMYFVTGWRKSGETWQDGTAVSLALQLEFFVTAFGLWFREAGSALLPLLTHGTRWLELLGPLIAFVPFRTAAVRMVLIPTFVVFHLSLAACLSIGFFPVAALVGWAPFVPRQFWDDVLPALGVGTRRPVPPTASGTRYRAHPVTQAFAASSLGFVIVFLAFELGLMGLPEPLRLYGNALRLNQHWSMFAPDAPVVTRWPVVEGITAEGVRLDLLQGGPVQAQRPPSANGLFHGFRPKYFFSKLIEVPPDDPLHEPMYASFTRTTCKLWNEHHPPREQVLEIVVGEIVTPTRVRGDSTRHEHSRIACD